MSLTYQPFAATPELHDLSRDRQMNLPESERVASGVAGFVLIGVGLARSGASRWLLVAAGVALLRRGWTGFCPWYGRLKRDRRHPAAFGVPEGLGIEIEYAVEIRRSPQVLYKFWQNLEELPRIMRHVEFVRRHSDKRSHWKVRGPLGTSLEWEAEIIDREEDRSLSWQTLPGATVKSAGSIWFEPTATGSTIVTAAFRFDPPGGALGATVSSFLGASPQKELEEDLARFRDYAERELPVFE